jgi:predicted Rossmann fold flavoprotein
MPLRKNKNGLPIIVIGCGPAGISAALAASESANKVMLLNKNPWPGKKVAAIPPDELIFAEKLTPKKLSDQFKDKSSFVAPSFKSFGYPDLVKLFKKYDLVLEADEAGHFRADGLPAKNLINTFLDEAIKKGVEYRKSSRVINVLAENGEVTGIVVNDFIIPASAVILATGSISSPKYGATRDGYLISEKLGHRVIQPRPALVDLIPNEKYGKLLDGQTFDDIMINIFFNGKSAHSEIGEIKFNSDAISGSTILNHSAEIVEKLAEGDIEIRLDFMPDQPRETFETWLIKQFVSRRQATIGRLLNRYLSEHICKAVEAESRVKLEKSIAHITNLERKSLTRAIKDFRLTVKKPKPFNYTRGVLGGVSVEDINPQTCESKIIKSLYFAGDIIDVLGPWGGYNMLFAFSSGHVAGKAAAGLSD